jgi:signal transduction histidine kinase
VRTGEPYALELEYVQADGQHGWLEARGEVVRGETGEVTKLRGTAHEVTLRHRMEDVRVEARATEAANRNKTLMLSRVSHELRTPLNAILGFSQLCEMDATMDPKHRRWAATIAGAGRHMLELVEEVLDLSAAELGRIDVRRADIELTSILQECLLHASAAAVAGEITLRGVDPASAPVRVLGDAKRVKQVINNLLSNAVKYSRAGGLVEVTLSDLGNGVEIAVQDTGIGLTREQLERLFLPFERLGAEATATPGTGLGLALSKRLVEMMGGSIRVESHAGMGSTFIVSLQKGAPHY